MDSLRIEVKRDLFTAAESIKELLDHKEIGAVSAKIYLAKFKLTQKALFNMIRGRVKQWIKEENKNRFLCVETGDRKYIGEAYHSFSSFLFSGEKEIENEAAYKNLKNDRLMTKILASLKSKAKKTKDGALNRALNGNTILGFFNRCGIMIVYRVDKGEK